MTEKDLAKLQRRLDGLDADALIAEAETCAQKIKADDDALKDDYVVRAEIIRAARRHQPPVVWRLLVDAFGVSETLLMREAKDDE